MKLSVAKEYSDQRNQISCIQDFLINNKRCDDFFRSMPIKLRNDFRVWLGVPENSDVYPFLARKLYDEGVRL